MVAGGVDQLQQLLAIEAKKYRIIGQLC